MKTTVEHWGVVKLAGVVLGGADEYHHIHVQRIFRPTQMLMNQGRGLLLRKIWIGSSAPVSISAVPLEYFAVGLPIVALKLETLHVGEQLGVTLVNPTEGDIRFELEFLGQSSHG